MFNKYDYEDMNGMSILYLFYIFQNQVLKKPRLCFNKQNTFVFMVSIDEQDQVGQIILEIK
jgi:hypothetical protein